MNNSRLIYGPWKVPRNPLVTCLFWVSRYGLLLDLLFFMFVICHVYWFTVSHNLLVTVPPFPFVLVTLPPLSHPLVHREASAVHSPRSLLPFLIGVPTSRESTRSCLISSIPLSYAVYKFFLVFRVHWRRLTHSTPQGPLVGLISPRSPVPPGPLVTFQKPKSVSCCYTTRVFTVPDVYGLFLVLTLPRLLPPVSQSVTRPLDIVIILFLLSRSWPPTVLSTTRRPETYMKLSCLLVYWCREVHPQSYRWINIVKT